MTHADRPPRVTRTVPRPSFSRQITALPYMPVSAYLALVGLLRLGHGGLVPDEGTFHHVAPHLLIFTWTFAIVIGGFASVFGSLFGATRTESSGLVLLLFGATFYGLGVTYEVGPEFSTISVSIAIVLMCFFRMRILTKARRAQKKAARIEVEHDIADLTHDDATEG